MSNLHTTARGRQIDMSALQLNNEHVVAIGNMKVNARGDVLGPGGKIVKTRAEVMAEFHQLKTPMADNSAVQIPVDPLTAPKETAVKVSTIEEDSLEDLDPPLKLVTPMAVDTPVVTETPKVKGKK